MDNIKATDYLERLKTTGRNDPCPCGSGKKYKKCHLNDDEAAHHKELVKLEQEAIEKTKKESEEEEDTDKQENQTKKQKNKSVSKPKLNKKTNQPIIHRRTPT